MKCTPDREKPPPSQKKSLNAIFKIEFRSPTRHKKILSFHTTYKWYRSWSWVDSRWMEQFPTRFCLDVSSLPHERLLLNKGSAKFKKNIIVAVIVNYTMSRAWQNFVCITGSHQIRITENCCIVISEEDKRLLFTLDNKADVTKNDKSLFAFKYIPNQCKTLATEKHSLRDNKP